MTDQKLTAHFSLKELTVSPVALRLGLDNTPSDEVIANLRTVAEALELVRTHFCRPVIVTSGYRSEVVNHAIRGSLTSAHRYGLAADFIVQDVPNIDVCRWIAENLVEFDQVIYEFGPTGWVHLGLAHKGMRRAALTARKVGSRTVYATGIQDLWS